MTDAIEISGSEEDGDSHGVESEVELCARSFFCRSRYSSRKLMTRFFRRCLHSRRPRPKLERARMRRIVHSSSSSEELPLEKTSTRIRHANPEIIEISDSDDEVEEVLFGGPEPLPPPPPPLDEQHDQTETDDNDDGLLVL
jgi:hypothetical protein